MRLIHKSDLERFRPEAVESPQTLVIHAEGANFDGGLVQAVFGAVLREYEAKRQKLIEDELFWLVPENQARPCAMCHQPRLVLAGFKIVVSPVHGSQAFLMAADGTVARIIGLAV